MKAQAPTGNILSAKASHDIRASINAILGYSEILKELLHELHTLDSQKIENNVDQIISRARHLLNLINDGGNPAGSKNRPETTVKSPKTIKVKLDYNIESHPRLLKALTKAKQRCFTIMKAMIISDVNAFGTDIVQIGNTYQSTALTKWGQSLKQHTANFNKHEMELMMQSFADIVLNVKRRKPGDINIEIIN